MSTMPVEVGRRAQGWRSDATEGPEIQKSLRIASLALRAIFIVLLVVVIMHVSMPEISTIWTAYQSPSDLVRIALGLGASIWIGRQLFLVPKDAHAYRTWLYLGLAAVPFTMIIIAGIW